MAASENFVSHHQISHGLLAKPEISADTKLKIDLKKCNPSIIKFIERRMVLTNQMFEKEMFHK